MSHWFLPPFQSLTQLLFPFIHRMFLKDPNKSQVCWHEPLIPALKLRPGCSARWAPGQPELHSEWLLVGKKQTKRWKQRYLAKLSFPDCRDTTNIPEQSGFSTKLSNKPDQALTEGIASLCCICIAAALSTCYTATAWQPSLLRTKQFKRKTETPSARQQHWHPPTITDLHEVKHVREKSL